MKKKAIVFAIWAFIFLSLGLVFSQQNPEDAKFQKNIDTYLDEYWKFYPSAATLAGYYKYNDKLEDLSAKNIEKRHDSLDLFNKEFVTKIDNTKLSPDFQIEHEMMRDVLDLEFLKHESLLPWDYNPIFYNEILINSIQGLLLKEFAPFDTRLKSATERLKLLPALIKQAKENLKTPPQIFTETAIKQFPAIMDFYRNELSQFAEKASPELKSRFQAEAAKVLPALEDYQKFLQNELLPRSTGNFRLGDQVHPRLLRFTCQYSLLPDEISAQAKADYNNIRREMAIVAMPFYRIMYPNINMEQLSTQYKEDDLRNIFIKGVLDKIKGEHVAKDDFINRIKTSADEIKNFLVQNKLLELPQENLNIEPMPPAFRGITWTRLVSPGAYETTGSYTCQVSPIPEGWSNEQIQSFLEEYSNFFLYFWTVRRVYPGQFVPIFFTRKDSSLIKRLYPNQALINGWPLYAEEMLVKSGFGNYDLRLRLNQLKLQLKAVIDFQLELNIHQGGMTKEQAVAYMMRGGFQSQAEAELNWNIICLKPGEMAYRYIGFQEILNMEKEYKKLKGDAFNQKEFLQKLLSYGALPLRHLKNKILQ